MTIRNGEQTDPNHPDQGGAGLPAAPEAADVPSLVRSLHSAIDSTLEGCSLRYHEPEHGLFIEYGVGGRHSLSYRLSHLDTPIGEVRIAHGQPLTEAHTEAMENLLAAALPRLYSLLRETPTTNTVSLDADTGLATRAALDDLLGAGNDGYGPDYGPAGVLLIRIDDPRTSPPAVLRRVALQIAAVVGDPDRLYRYDDMVIAVALYPGDTDTSGVIAERIRLMVAAMPVALPAPTVTVVVLGLGAKFEREKVAAAAERLANDTQRRNRVIDAG
jgi:GGDEF domain-containing protein